MTNHKPLPVGDLFRACDPARFKFKDTSELEPLEELIGQDRAVEAVEFGIGIRRDGYNLFAAGPAGTGKHTLIAEFLQRQAKSEPVPDDLCYVYNFEDPRRPKALRLPAGRAQPLAMDMQRLTEDLRAAIQSAFESEDYRNRREALAQEFKERQEGAFEDIQKKARDRSIALVRTPVGLALAPLREGQVLSPEEFEALPEAEREKAKDDLRELEEQLQTTLRQAPRWEREHRDRVREINREVTRLAIDHLIEEIRKKHEDLPEILNWLNAIEQDVVDKAETLIATEQAPGGEAPQQAGHQPPRDGIFRQYTVNVLVSRDPSSGAPVIYEDHPIHGNLLGRIEHRSEFGMLVTDFTLIKAGALHRANGGYLVLDALKLLTQPFAWEGLKRILRAREVQIESLGQSLSIIDTVSLDPEPVPLDIKIILVGERTLYYLLCEYDPDFSELFKVQADFEDDMSRDEASVDLYARLIGTIARNEKMRPFDPGAVGRVIERAARIAGDREKLTTHMRSVADLLHESDYWAGKAGRNLVTAKDVTTAVDAHIRRSDRLREKVQEVIAEGIVLIDSAGTKPGQINGLSVMQLGGFAFGRPSRITARVSLGRGHVIDIEREVKLGGPLHSKGVLILSGFLADRFGRDRPLALAASLVFEQSYGGIDGDSASSAELYALISALSGVPIRQGFAVTGSVNQRGEVQAIGGANEKIEGFFDVCKARGLTGEQGVLIPATNTRHLMLREDVVEACRDGKFAIHAVDSIDQGLEILTGVPAGTPDGEGIYPEGSINRLVADRLAGFAEMARKMGGGGNGKNGNDGEKQDTPLQSGNKGGNLLS
ncbi:MAG: AAA family ATPase [Alphaproteobacteria bacterium]|nr:AAA family ATPase [Alphaproteobacteria bacterium]